MGGVDKPGLELGGRSLRARVVEAVSGADAVLLVGPPSDDDAALPAAVRRVVEEPPYAGPLAALSTAVPLVEQDVMLVLAADLVHPQDLPAALVDALAAAPDAEAAVAVDADGRRQWLAAAYRTAAVRRALVSLDGIDGVDGHRFGDLVDLLIAVDVPRADTADIDTPDDLARARADFTED
jgi:molybdopterin-guanine dinucleotide biosynthesis protein A